MADPSPFTSVPGIFNRTVLVWGARRSRAVTSSATSGRVRLSCLRIEFGESSTLTG